MPALQALPEHSNYYVASAPYAFESQAHEAYFGQPSCGAAQPLSAQFVKVGYSACPFNREDFIRAEVVYDVQRGGVLQVKGAEAHASHPMLQALMHAHTPQLDVYRAGQLCLARDKQKSALSFLALSRQAAHLAHICKSFQNAFSARLEAEVPSLVRHYLERHRRMEPVAVLFEPLERALERLELRGINLYFEVMRLGPVFHLDVQGGVPLRILYEVQTIAMDCARQALMASRPGWFGEVGTRGQILIRASAAGFSRSLALCPMTLSRTLGAEARADGFFEVGPLMSWPPDVRQHFDQIRTSAVYS